MNGKIEQWMRGTASTANHYTQVLPIYYTSRTSYTCVCASNDYDGLGYSEMMSCYCVNNYQVQIFRRNHACTDWSITTKGY